MNLEMIAERLQDEGVGRMGQTIFINHMPVEASVGVLLRPPYVGTPIDYELPGYRKTKFNAAVRGKNYKEASALAQRVMEALTFNDVEISGLEVRHVRPLTEPVSFPVSEGSMVEFLVIFEATYVIVE
jgi:hypothetical protein